MSLSSQIKVPAQVKGAVGGGSGGGATSLDGLSDVAITSAASGDFLRNNGTNFVNTPLSESDIPSTLNTTAFPLFKLTDATTLGTASDRFWGPASGSTTGTVQNVPTGGTHSGLVNNSTIWFYNSGGIGSGGYTSLNTSSGTVVKNQADSNSTQVLGGSGNSQSNGPVMILYGNTHATAPGRCDYYPGSGASGRHDFYDAAGALRLRLDTGVKPQGTGGAGHYLKQSSANGAISSGAPLQNEMTYSGYYAGKTSDQSIAANTTADVTLTANEQTSADITHSTSTNPAEFTVNTTQKYAIDFVCSALIAATTTLYQVAEFTLYVNGVAVRRAYTYTYNNAGNTHGQNAVLNWEGPITAGQIVKVTCKNNSGSNALNLRGQTSSINLTSMRIQGRGV